MINREDARKILGEDATEEQVTNLLNNFHLNENAKIKDLQAKLEEMQNENSKYSDYDAIKKQLDDINKANMFMDNNIVDTEYFLLFKEKNNDVIMKRIRQLINAFASAGLNSHQVTNDDLRVILDNFLNGGQTTGFGTVIS